LPSSFWPWLNPLLRSRRADLTVFAVQLWIGPEDPRGLYALMYATNGSSGNDRFLARSTDGGTTWKLRGSCAAGTAA